MQVLNVQDVNEALPRGLALLRDSGQWQDSRAGRVLVAPTPVTTIYRDPRRRVLFDSTRDANPFFHLFEALWILAGRKDVRTLDWYNSRMKEYSDNRQDFHAPYGFRMRRERNSDQVGIVCNMLRENRDERRCVVQIWDSSKDLGVKSADIPCNDMLFFRCTPDGLLTGGHTHKLDITVSNRSNDVVWGAYGANAVQFSILQEYMAAKIGVAVGQYYQVSNNYHVYESNPYWQHWIGQHTFGGGYAPDEEVPYASGAVETTPITTPANVELFDMDLRTLFAMADSADSRKAFVKLLTTHPVPLFKTEFFREVLTPMLWMHSGYLDDTFGTPWNNVPVPTEWRRCDWLNAGIAWINRRNAKKQAANS